MVSLPPFLPRALDPCCVGLCLMICWLYLFRGNKSIIKYCCSEIALSLTAGDAHAALCFSHDTVRHCTFLHTHTHTHLEKEVAFGRVPVWCWMWCEITHSFSYSKSQWSLPSGLQRYILEISWWFSITVQSAMADMCFQFLMGLFLLTISIPIFFCLICMLICYTNNSGCPIFLCTAEY